MRVDQLKFLTDGPRHLNARCFFSALLSPCSRVNPYSNSCSGSDTYAAVDLTGSCSYVDNTDTFLLDLETMV